MTRRTSRTEAAITARLDKLDPESERFKVLAAAKEFKASWVELGELLTVVREKEVFSAWGYASFDAYCRRELQIKQETANKLTRSFAFLRDHEPKMLDEGRSSREVPALDVVDLLSQARERTKISDGEFDTIREEVFAAEAAPTRNDVMKRLREADPEAFRPAPKPANAVGENDLRKALLLAERLQSLLEAQNNVVSADGMASAGRLVSELRERFAQTQRQGAA